MPIDCFVITFEPCNLFRFYPEAAFEIRRRRQARPRMIGGARLSENDPDYASDLGGQRDCHLVDMHSRSQLIDPLTPRRSLLRSRCIMQDRAP
jgi:hypothetical protein